MKLFFILLFIQVFVISPIYTIAYAKKAENNPKDTLLKRIDFGSSYIMGQTIKSGAVYLLHRKKSKIKSMLKYRENYREEILENSKFKADTKQNEKKED